MYPSLCISIIIFTHCEIPSPPPKKVKKNTKMEDNQHGNKLSNFITWTNAVNVQPQPPHKHELFNNRNALWDIWSCLLLGYDPKNGDSIFLQNVGTYLPSNTKSHSTTKHSPQFDNRSSWKHSEQSRLLKLCVHKQYQNMNSRLDNVLPSSQ